MTFTKLRLGSKCRRCLTMFLFLSLSNCALGISESNHLISPPLAIIQNQSLEIKLPSGWNIVKRDPPANWHSSSYDFEVANATPSSMSSNATIEVLMHAIGRARRHGDLNGTPFRTASGIRGIEHEMQASDGAQDWYFAIPSPATSGAIIVRVANLTGARGHQWHFVHDLFRGVRFVGTATTAAADSIPPMAHLAGVTVGHSTIEGLERKLGPGFKYTGQHPHGGRAWRVHGTKSCYINADGFDYHNSGDRVIDTFSVGSATCVESDNSTRQRINRSKLSWMGSIYPGVTEATVKRVTQRKLPRATIKGEKWTWHMKGVAHINSHGETFTDWTAEVELNHGRVSAITVWCE